MGVTGLWQIVQPCARPIKIETLNRKRLAVDASIWIYQFLKAVRDKEGNALRNSHVVGFFRRICKLLFFGIKPVFVFDGGAPALKRQTIRARKARREGRREDAVRTAGKLLAVQMQRRAEEEEARRRVEGDHAPEQEEDIPDEGLVYVDELHMTQQERQQNRKFRKKDQYHLPDLGVSMSEMGGPNDPRVMSLEELQAYARQFDTGEDINVYDFSQIDYDSPFFMSLPPSDRYNILNAARLRSRLRMGHSKEQLDSMFPDRMAFSKFQIERVRERNELTQRLMHLNGFETMDFGGGRVAGEKGREYVLVKNDGVEGGWALGVISDEGRQEKPIDIDQSVSAKNKNEDSQTEDDEDFEDIPIEGLNRLPKRKTRDEEASHELLKQRRAISSPKRQTARKRRKLKVNQDPDSLFIQSSEGENDEEREAVDASTELFDEEDDEDQLQRAIAMSLGKDREETSGTPAPGDPDAEDDDMLEVFQQTAAEEQRPLPKGSGRHIASIVNKRALQTAPESREITSFGVPSLRPEDSNDEDDGMDFQAALAESRRNKRKTSPPRHELAESASDIAKKAGFKGPLPFAKLDLGSSLLGKNKMQERTEEAAGGFENPEFAPKEQKKTAPLPPWFAGDLEEDMAAQNAIEAEDRRKAIEFNEQFRFEGRGEGLRRADTSEVIDLESDVPGTGFTHGEVIDLEDDELRHEEPEASHPTEEPIRMGNTAHDIRAELDITHPSLEQTSLDTETPIAEAAISEPQAAQDQYIQEHSSPKPGDVHADEDEEMLEWSESDRERESSAPATAPAMPGSVPNHESRSAGSSPTSTPIESLSNDQDTAVRSAPARNEQTSSHRSLSVENDDVEFEDVGISNLPPREQAMDVDDLHISPIIEEGDFSGPSAPSGLDAQDAVAEDDEFDDFSDPEDAEILRALTLEAEEHARFASSLNNKTQNQNVQEYERELKQLRNQQKKDRRDADEVTQIMIQECQALLRLFGLPYITAPMEAEAQCAELVRLGLVDGIVTDDSDCFLFGGTRIYKNMFNQAKFVECYLTSDLEKEFALTRDKLIAVAHLLGSDYTEGLPGIGPVTAVEIVSEFQTLEDFKEWWTGVQMNQIPKADDATNTFRKKFRRNATKIFLPPSFPDQRVNIAYQNPDVDADPQAFQWGVPDLDALRSFLMSTIGWDQERTDEVLVPVIRDMNRRVDEGTQSNITHFFDGTVGIGAANIPNADRAEGFAPRKRLEGSKRMGSALSKMAERAKVHRAGSVSDGSNQQAQVSTITNGSDSASPPAKAPKKRKPLRHSASATAGSGDGDSDFDVQQKEKPRRRQGARKATGRKKTGTDLDE